MAGLVKLVALSVLPLAALGGPSFPPASTNCTEASSKSASWVLRNFTFDTDTRFDYGPGTAGKASFSIQNTANGYAFSCVQGDGSTGRLSNRYLLDKKVWYSCNVFCKGAKGRPEEEDPPLDTSFHFDVKTKALSISQTWGCAGGAGWNTSASTNYTGTGTSIISNLNCSQVPGGRPDQVSCAPVDVTVKASNVSIAVSGDSIEDQPEEEEDPYMGGGTPAPSPFLPPIIPVPAVLPGTPGCSKLSQDTSWRISNFFWSGGGVSFTLKSNSLNYTQRCSISQAGQSVGGRVRNPTWSNCTRFDNMHVNYPSNEVYTSLLFGGPKNTLGINQTWYCSDEDASKPTIYSVYGEANFPIKCKETRYCLPPSRFDPGSLPELAASESCIADDLTITATHTNTSRVSKAEAVESFRPRGYNCSSKSITAAGAQVWDVTRFTLERTVIPADPKANFTGGNKYQIEFYYNNTATDNDWPRNDEWRQCLYMSDGTDEELDGMAQLNCSISFEPYRLAFKFDNATSTLTLNQGWNCDGIDTRHTNFFTGSGSINLPLQCQSSGGNTKCKAGSSRFTVPIANVTSRLNANQSADYSYIPGAGVASRGVDLGPWT